MRKTKEKSNTNSNVELTVLYVLKVLKPTQSVEIRRQECIKIGAQMKA
jgi:hypothetical protein